MVAIEEIDIGGALATLIPLTPHKEGAVATLKTGDKEELVSGEFGSPPLICGGLGGPPLYPLPLQYSDVLKTSKKSYITKDNIGEIMLSQIPGISINVAQSLMGTFKTIKNLINEFEKNDKCLDTFQVDCKNGKRKINKTVIKNIKEFLIETSS